MTATDAQPMAQARYKQKGTRHLPDEADRLYAISGCCHRKDSWSWAVNVARHGRRIKRSFSVEIYGSREAALAEAKAYRDAVMNLFPAVTNYESAQRIRDRNTSGISGVYRTEHKSNAAWAAALTRSDGKKIEYFSINKYGERHAKALAIEARQKLLDEMETTFLIAPDEGRHSAEATFSDLLAEPEITMDQTNLASLMAEGEAKLAEIDREFDARRPRYIKLRLAVRGPKRRTLRLLIGIGDNSLPVHDRTVAAVFHPDRRPITQALAYMREKASEIIERLLDADARETFMRRHGKAFTEKNFDVVNGLTIRDRIARPPRRPTSSRAAPFAGRTAPESDSPT